MQAEQARNIKQKLWISSQNPLLEVSKNSQCKIMDELMFANLNYFNLLLSHTMAM